LLTIKDNGSPDEWDIQDSDRAATRTQKIAEKLIPNLKILKNCGQNIGCSGYPQATYLKGSNTVDYDQNVNYYKIILADGSYMWFRGAYSSSASEGGYSNAYGSIFYDINGKKAPNTYGKDIFVFVILKSNIMPDKSNNCRIDSYGEGCASYVILNGNMNYLKK
jgi:hypothetical protein